MFLAGLRRVNFVGNSARCWLTRHVSIPTDHAHAPNSGLDSFQPSLKLAFELYNSGRHAEAESACLSLMQINPRDGQLLFLLGMILQKTGRNSEALKYLEQAAELQPQAARIYNGLGAAHQSLHDPARAVDNYARAVELGLQASETFYNMGNACYEIGDVERAALLFQNAVEINPQDVASWNNLGKCLVDLNRLDESMQAYDRAVAIDPDHALAHYGRAISLLTAGRLQDGFREYNRWRRHGIKPRQFPQPEWHGEPVPGSTLFLHAEQGFGDAIQNVRLVSLARDRVGKVVLECRPELKTLFMHSECADVIISFGEEIPPFDCFTSLINLPGILDITLSTIPNRMPYLKVPSGGQLPPAPNGHLRVGLAWAGNPSHHNDAARSIHLEELAPLLRVPGITFYSLQTPVPAHDKACFQSMSLVDLSGGLKDFLTAAKAVAEMDMIISVDTAVLHLAGALAKPVWALIPSSSDWRWLKERLDSPWYPTMRLFRQPQRGRWQPVIAQVSEELVNFHRA